MQSVVEFAAVGDVGPSPEAGKGVFAAVAPLLREAHLRFAQCEFVFSNRGKPGHMRQPPARAAEFADVPFDIVGVGSNHNSDYGPEALEDSIATFEQLGITTIGAGRNIADARRPRVVERNGLRIAFLGYVSVLPPNFWATADRAGAAPMRVRTYYEPYEWQPGTPARVVTIPHEKDLADVVADVTAAKAEADLVICSFHWGVHFIPKPVAMYMPVVAHAAIDAGAAAIIGHHQHLMQGVAVYKGCPIVYGMGNFAFSSLKRLADRKGGPLMIGANQEFALDDVYGRQVTPSFTYHPEMFSPDSGIFFFRLAAEGVQRLSYRPTVMDENGRPALVEPHTPKFAEMKEYLEWVSAGMEGGISEIRTEDDRMLLYEGSASRSTAVPLKKSGRILV